MPTLSPLTSPFENATIVDDSEENLDEEILADDDVDFEDEEEVTETESDSGGLSAWKREVSEQTNEPEDNGGGLSKWKTKRKRNGYKGRTPKHPLNKRPYTC